MMNLWINLLNRFSLLKEKILWTILGRTLTLGPYTKLIPTYVTCTLLIRPIKHQQFSQRSPMLCPTRIKAPNGIEFNVKLETRIHRWKAQWVRKEAPQMEVIIQCYQERSKWFHWMARKIHRYWQRLDTSPTRSNESHMLELSWT